MATQNEIDQAVARLKRELESPEMAKAIKAMEPTKFQRGRNRGTRVCAQCGKRTWDARIDPSTGLCADCYDAAGIENEHADGYHQARRDPRCPACESERKQIANWNSVADGCGPIYPDEY